MKKLYWAFIVPLIFAAACEKEDLVKGSIPAKQQTTVSFGTRQIIIYFKDRIDPSSLSLGNIFFYRDAECFSGPEVFQDPPSLLKSSAVAIDDALVLKFLGSFELQEGKKYKFTMSGHRLYCASQDPRPSGCYDAEVPFKLAFDVKRPEVYEPDYDPSDDPPYIVSSSPPDKTDFPAAPTFPPHGIIDIVFSEPLPNFTLTASSDQVSLGDTLIPMIPQDVLTTNGDANVNDVIPFNSSIHKHVVVTSVQGWPINKAAAFTIISTPSNLPQIIADCVASGATVCNQPSLSNIVLAPTTDSSYAPIIMAGVSAMVETLPGSSIFRGVYKQPSGNAGSIGTTPDNLDVLVRFARVKIAYPRSGYFDYTQGNIVSGIYTYDSVESENVSAITISVKNIGTGVITPGTAIRDNGIFTYNYSPGFVNGGKYSIRASAGSPDNEGGFDIVNSTATADIASPIITITSPTMKHSVVEPLPLVLTGTASDVNTGNSGIAWVKVNGEYASYNGITGTYSYTFSSLPDGRIDILVEAQDKAGNLGAHSDFFFFYVDTDDDYMPDDYERSHPCLNPAVADGDIDSDGDGLKNLDEYNRKTDPCHTDSDRDTMPDDWEVANGFNPLDPSDAAEDKDSDSLTNAEEFANGTSPSDKDTDDDWLEDGCEVKTCSNYAWTSNPLNPDSDGDGLLDREGLDGAFGTSPNNPDSDGDTMPDGWEVFNGLDPDDSRDAKSHGDTDHLNNLEEYSCGSNPQVADSDADGFDDKYECANQAAFYDPNLSEYPRIFQVSPPVAALGATIMIEGTRLGPTPLSSTTVSVNGIASATLDCPNDSGGEIICVQVPAGAQSHTPAAAGIRVTAQYGSTPWHSEMPFPFKATDSTLRQFPEKDPGPTSLVLDGQTVFFYGYLRQSDRDAFTISIAGRSVLNVRADAFDTESDSVITSGNNPDTYLSVINSAGKVIAANDDDPAGGTKNSAISGLILEPGDYTIMGTVPNVEGGNTSTGFYELSVDMIEAPFITGISPAVGIPGINSITIQGCNFSASGNRVILSHDGVAQDAIIDPDSESTDSITATFDVTGASVTDGYTVIIERADLVSSEDPEVETHNAPSRFYVLVPFWQRPESVFSSVNLLDGRTGEGFVGTGRGEFYFRGFPGDIIEFRIEFHDPVSGALDSGSPELNLYAPDGTLVPRYPGYPLAPSPGAGIDQYALAQTGTYTVVARGVGPGIPPYYNLTYSRVAGPVVTDISKVNPMDSTTVRYALEGATTVINNLKVQITPAKINVPVIFKTEDSGYVAYTDASGIAVGNGIKSPRGPIQFRVTAFPAGYVNLYTNFYITLAPVFSKDDWDGDGVSNAQELINSTNPLDIDSNNDKIIDGFVASPTDTDTDGDGLSNEWEAYFKTNASGVFGIDSDRDIYPDGWEVNNGLNPSIYGPMDKLIPEIIHLGYNPDTYACIKFYGVARDMTGHFRKNMDLAAGANYTMGLCGSEAFTNGVGLGYVGLEPIWDLAQEVYPTRDGYPSLGRHFRVTMLINQCTELQPCYSQSDSMGYVAIPQGTLLYRYPFDSTDLDVGLFSNEAICVWVHATHGQVQKVVFNVPLEQGNSVTDEFQNAKLSARATRFAENNPIFEYPVQFPFLGDDTEASGNMIDVMPDEYGVACARFFTGNTSNFDYRIKASLGGLSVGWTINTESTPPAKYLGTDIRKSTLPEFAAPGTKIPIYVYTKKYSLNKCNGSKCAYDILPIEGTTVVWKHQVDNGQILEHQTTHTDANGMSTITYPFNNVSNNAKIWAYAIGVSTTVDYVKPAVNIKIRMARGDGYGVYRDLPDNGIVSSSLLGIGDERIKVWIENKPDYFLKLKLIEIPATTGKDMLLPRSISYDHPNLTNEVVVFPDPNREYYFDLAPNAARGQFVFKLYNKDGTQFLLDSATAEIGNDYLDFTCQHSSTDIRRCQGSLKLMSASGEVLYSTKAKSGVNDRIEFPALPYYDYFIDAIESRHPKYFDLIGVSLGTAAYCSTNSKWDKDCAYCDAYGTCWYAHFQPDPIYDKDAYDTENGKYGRDRKELGLHPGGRGEGWTEGCIGIEKTEPSSWLFYKISSYKKYFGDLVVKVHP